MNSWQKSEATNTTAQWIFSVSSRNVADVRILFSRQQG
ncbi:hypothetical protein AC15_2927 [Escherichia coli 2-156-04_S3_C2]|nr:hypothetical protein AC15_2927 [Escherichia coli 2-156-04_S3_C2]